MKIPIKTLCALALLGGTFAGVASFSRPAETAAFALLGFDLGPGQRDFRVFNNFTDSQANNNTVFEPNFPGHFGAVQAIWKAHAEWSSVFWAGNGEGDPLQNNLGNRQANFDNTFQGEAFSTGSIGDNTHSELGGSSGSTLAFMQGGSGGWWIRYYSTWTWQDGPGSVGGGVDLQGVACHEAGHSLGLGHSSNSGATMFASISGSGTGQRSTNSDDKAGIQAVYGLVGSTKPEITGVSGTLAVGGTITITGVNFSSSDNDVWFNKVNSNGVAQKVTNVGATGGGTTITVSIPAGVEDGEVLVRSFDGTGGGFLSNAWPIDLGGAVGDPPLISGLGSTLGPAGGFDDVVIDGTGFNGTTQVQFGGVDALSFSVDSNTQITATTPGGLLFDTVDVRVVDDEGEDTLTDAYVYGFNPNPDIDTVTPDTGDEAGGTSVTITGASVVGATDVTFGGVSGTGLTVTSATSLTVTTPSGSVGPVDVSVTVGDVFGSDTDTITDGFTYTGGPAGDFVDLGPSGVSGLLGEPSFTGTGDLTPGSATGYSTTLSGAAPSTPCYLFFNFDELQVPFKGGTFYPNPTGVFTFIIPSDVTGTITLPNTIPGDWPAGFDIVAQWWYGDASAPFGATGSNGLLLDIPF